MSNMEGEEDSVVVIVYECASGALCELQMREFFLRPRGSAQRDGAREIVLCCKACCWKRK